MGYEFIDDVIAHTGNAHIIITTRNSYLGPSNEKYMLKFGEEDNDEENLYKVFKKNYEQINEYGDSPELDEKNEEFVKNICHLFSDNILAVELIAKQLKESYGDITIEEYYNKLDQSLKNFREVSLDDNLSNITSYEHNNIYDYQNMNSYELLKSIVFDSLIGMQKRAFNNDELKVLFTLSYIQMRGISRDNLCIISNLTLKQFKSVHSNLIRLGWISYQEKETDEKKEYIYIPCIHL